MRFFIGFIIGTVVSVGMGHYADRMPTGDKHFVEYPDGLELKPPLVVPEPLIVEWLDCIKWEQIATYRCIDAPTKKGDCLIERGLRSDGVLVWKSNK